MKKKAKSDYKDLIFVYGAYIKLIANEKHYTVSQAKYKINAAYWLLVIFIAIGIIFSAHELIPIDRTLTVSIICLIGIFGLHFIWYEDLINQERILNLNQLKALKLEETYSWLPSVHHQHVIITHKTMLKYKNLFYIGCNFILFIILELSFFFYFFKIHYIISIVCMSLFLLAFLYLCKWMFVKVYTNELKALEEVLNVK